MRLIIIGIGLILLFFQLNNTTDENESSYIRAELIDKLSNDFAGANCFCRLGDERGYEVNEYANAYHDFGSLNYWNTGGGTNKRCVYLTLREHYIAHALLMKGFIKRYGIDDDRSAKMIYAFHMMNIMCERIGYPNSYLYETSREHYINMRIGRKRKPFTKIHMQRLIESAQKEKNNFYGRTHSEESKLKQRLVKLGKCDGEKNPFYGKKHSEEKREKMKKEWELRRLKMKQKAPEETEE